MKKTVFLLLSIISLHSAIAQVETKNLEVKNIVPEQNYLVNSVTNAELIGGRNRIIIPVYLPANTKEWVYVFSCSSSDNGQSIIKLCSNLASAIDVTQTTSQVIDAITAPNGDTYCDVYLLDEENKSKFEIDGEGYRIYTIGTKKNIKNGVVPITGLNKGPFYIGILNNDATSAINVRIEVAALVENTEVDLTQWSVEKKNEMYEGVKAELIKEGMEEANAKKMAACLIKKIVAETSLEALNKMAEFEKDELLKKIEADCRAELGF